MARLRISYRLSLAVAIPLFVVTIGGLLLGRAYVTSKQSIAELSSTLFREVARATAERTRQHLREAQVATETLVRLEHDRAAADRDEELAGDLEALLRVHDGFSWVSFADASGAFAGVYRPAPGKVRLNRSHLVTDAEGTRTELVEEELDDEGRRALFRRERDSKYDPRQREWFQRARKARRTVWMPPYRFAGQDVLGITCATPQLDRHGAATGVYTVDFDLQALSTFVARLELSAHGEVFVFDAEGHVLAHPRWAALTRAMGHDLPRLDEQAGALRAVSAALAGNDPDRSVTFTVAGRRWLGRALRATEAGGPDWLVGVIAPEEDFLGPLAAASRTSLVIGLVALAVAVLLSWWLATRIAGPLASLSSDMDAVGRFELAQGPARRSVFSEIARMQEALSQMKHGLASFARFVPRDSVRRLLASGVEARLGGELRELTIFFSDISGFTTFAEQRSPEELVALLGGYLEAMTETITAAGGTVDKYVGDGIVAFWGAPVEDPDHAGRAARAALACQARLAALAATPEGAWIASTHTRIGLATGRVLVGNVGTPDRLNYTVMGDVANLAARLESLSKQYRTRMLVSHGTYVAARHAVVMRPVDVVAVKGKAEATRVYELRATQDAADADAARKLARTCDEALRLYLARDFAAAAAAWRAVLAEHPDDGPAQVMAARAERFAAAPPPSDWAGVYEALEK